MKPEINAASEFLCRIFLAHDNISSEKVGDFKLHLNKLLEERFRDHWHEGCPTKGQAYRCIRVCPEEPLDPILEKVCGVAGINTEDFNLPMELTLWVDPTEVVCKFGDLKCSYHTVAKKDQSSGALDNQTEHLDIDDLVENARDLYLKKQTVVIHPINSTEIPYPDSSPGGITMALRMNNSMHYTMSSSPPSGYDVSPRGKNKPSHSMHHKRSGYHYYSKGQNGKGTYVANGTVNANSLTTSHAGNANGNGGYQNHRGGHGQQHQIGSSHHHQHQVNGDSAYHNGYLNGYPEENGFSYDHRSTSPTKVNGMPPPPPPTMNGRGPQISQNSPTPEQIQQQMQHPPPLPPPSSLPPPHLQQAFSHPPGDANSMPPPPPTPHGPPRSQQQLPPPRPPASSSVIAPTTTSSSSNMFNKNSNNNNTGTTDNGNKADSSGISYRRDSSGAMYLNHSHLREPLSLYENEEVFSVLDKIDNPANSNHNKEASQKHFLFENMK